MPAKSANDLNVAKFARIDGTSRAACDSYEDFDPRGAFIRRLNLSESQYASYKAEYETAYLGTLKTLHRGRFA